MVSAGVPFELPSLAPGRLSTVWIPIRFSEKIPSSSVQRGLNSAGTSERHKMRFQPGKPLAGTHNTESGQHRISKTSISWKEVPTRTCANCKDSYFSDFLLLVSLGTGEIESDSVLKFLLFSPHLQVVLLLLSLFHVISVKFLKSTKKNCSFPG